MYSQTRLILDVSSTNQLFRRKCLESFYIDHNLLIFLLNCLFIATYKCFRASLVLGMRNLCLVPQVGSALGVVSGLSLK